MISRYGSQRASEANMYSIPLSDPFPAHAFMSADLYKTIPLPSGTPYQAAASNAQMFYDNTTLSLFYANYSASSRGFPSYNTFTNSWSDEVSVAGYDANTDTILSQFPYGSFAQGVSVPSTGISVSTMSCGVPHVLIISDSTSQERPPFQHSHIDYCAEMKVQFHGSIRCKPRIGSYSRTSHLAGHFLTML